ncbi:MAG: preprotein translocase subunit SecE [Paludibacteraceae bacterium]|nr:preprotein translocase subunit SecE [Paludibacteraceae bacterium]
MKIVDYCKESYNELVHKTTWPSMKELTNSAVVVLVASLILSLIIWLIDLGFEEIMKFIYSLLG